MNKLIYCRKCNKKYVDENTVCCGRKVTVYDETNEFIGSLICKSEERELK